jgi:hypothetical protein
LKALSEVACLGTSATYQKFAQNEKPGTRLRGFTQKALKKIMRAQLVQENCARLARAKAACLLRQRSGQIVALADVRVTDDQSHVIRLLDVDRHHIRRLAIHYQGDIHIAASAETARQACAPRQKLNQLFVLLTIGASC